MTKLEYLLYALNNDYYLHRDWVIRAFGYTQPVADDQIQASAAKAQGLVRTLAGIGYVDDTGQFHLLEENHLTPLYPHHERVTVDPSQIKLETTQTQPFETSYGRLLANYILIWFPFTGKLPYLNDRMDPDAIVNKLTNLFHDDPEDGVMDPSTLYISDYKRFSEAVDFFSNFTQLWVPGDTERSLTTHPDMVKRKRELYEQYRDRLHDKAALAELQHQLYLLDQEWLKEDPSLALWTSEKDFKIIRMKLYMTLGHDSGFGGDEAADPVANSLLEGWDLTKFPAYVNSSRAGSYKRGIETAKGGELAKWFSRITSTVNIVPGDCGTPLGIHETVDSDIAKSLIGMNLITKPSAKDLTWRGIRKTIDMSHIREFEMMSGLNYPLHLKEFLKAHNAGTPGKNRYDTEHARGREFGELLSYNRQDPDNVFDVYMQSLSILPKGYVALARDANAGLICVDRHLMAYHWNGERLDPTGTMFFDLVTTLYSSNVRTIKEEDLPGLMGQTVHRRSMLYCYESDTNYCATCAGVNLADNPTGASSAVTLIGNVIMYASMQAMHGTVLSTELYDPSDQFH